MDLLYSDEHLVAFNKPSGLLVHRSEIDRRESRFALQMARNQLGRFVYPVHRLDRPTSGVLLFALCSDTARRLTEQFASRQVRKTYLCVVRGYTEAEGLIDYPLTQDLDRYADADSRSDKGPQPAQTAYKRLATVELPFGTGRYATSRYSLLTVQPKTGRKHQIRRHLKHLFHPLIGDTKHGEGRHNRLFRTHVNCHRLLLAATELSLDHPVTGQPLNLTAPLDDTFKSVLDQLGWNSKVPSAWLAP